MKKILGFDCSSTTLAYSVLETDGYGVNLIHYGYIKPIKKGSIIERLADTRDKIKSIIEKHKPDHIAIEEIIQFMAGKSTAKTIITLTSFNRMIGLLSFDYLGKPPTLINVMAIRHCIKRKIGMTNIPKKEELPNLLEIILGIKFPWVLNKNNKIKEESYDISDAICCAYCYAMSESPKTAIKTKKKKVK